VSPRVFVCFGTGGVGKTTMSAALGTALARRGVRTLVVTCDPARRLAEAFGVVASPLPVCVDARELLWCYMPEAVDSARRSVALLFGDDPKRLAGPQQNSVLAVLVDGLAGMHELGALAQLVERCDAYDAVVIDTAPTRHALELLRLPKAIARLVDSRGLRWLESVSRRRLASSEERDRSTPLTRLFAWSEARLLAELEGSLGGASVAACMELLTAGMSARPALAQIAQRASGLLTGADTTYVVVAAPREGVQHDVDFFCDELTAIAHPPAWLLLNRAAETQPAWAQRLAGCASASESLRHAARVADQELAAQARRTSELRRAVATRRPNLQQIAIAKLDASDPVEVARAAADTLDLMLRTGPWAAPTRQIDQPSSGRR
jgi:anion-transporting  ArsA/GET3 family ATPase